MSTDPQCTLKCKDKIVWEELSTLIPKDSSYLLPSVTRDPDNPGHFKTWHQLCDARNALQFDDIGLHFSVANIGNCAKGCRYYFSSEADKSRHIRLVHGGKKGYMKLILCQQLQLMNSHSSAGNAMQLSPIDINCLVTRRIMDMSIQEEGLRKIE